MPETTPILTDPPVVTSPAPAPANGARGAVTVADPPAHTVPVAPAHTNGVNAPNGAQPSPALSLAAPPARKGGGARGFFLTLLLLAALAGGGYFGYNYWLDAQRYVSTDDALVDSNLVSIASSVSGTLTNWRIQPGDFVRAGQVLGTVRVSPTGGSTALINVLSPQDGTVLKVDGKEGQVIGATVSLAYLADLSALTITAYIDETDVHRVQVGQSVDVQVDGTGSQHYQGSVREIVPAAASQFAIIQTQDRGSGNFTKVTQRVEVHINLGDTSDSGLYPGMNAHAKIAVV